MKTDKTKAEGADQAAPESNSEQAGGESTASDILESIDFSDDGADVLDTGVDEFSAAMESIGQDTLIGQLDDEDDSVYADEDDEADPFEDVENASDEDDEAGDDDEADGDEDAPEDEDEEAETDGDEDDEPEDEAEVDDNDETPQPADLSAVYARLKESVGLELDSPESLAKAIEDEVNANQTLIEAWDNEPKLLAITRAVLGGKNIAEAVIDAIGELDDDSPDVIRARARQEALQEAQAERLELAQQKADEDLAAFKQTHNMSDEDLAGFRQQVSRYVYGDPRTGQLPSDFLDVMHRGLRYNQDVAEAKNKGKVEGKNEAVRDTRKKRKAKGDGLPTGRSGRTEPNPAPREASLENLAADLTSTGVLENF